MANSKQSQKNGGRNAYYKPGGAEMEKRAEAERKEALSEVGTTVSTNPSANKVEQLHQTEKERAKLLRKVKMAKRLMR